MLFGNAVTAITPPAMSGMGYMGNPGIGMGDLADLAYLGQLYGQLGAMHAAMTAAERKAKAEAAAADRAQKQAEAHAKAVEAQAARQAAAQEKAGQRQAAQQTRQAAAQQAQAARQAAQQANKAKQQATQQANKANAAAKQAEAKAKQVKAAADKKAKAAALRDKRIAGRTVKANEKDSALIDKITPQVNDAQSTIQNALNLAKKAIQTRNQNDKVAAVNAAKTAGQKINAIMGGGGGMSGMRGFGDIVQDPNTGQYIDTNTGAVVDPNSVGGVVSTPYSSVTTQTAGSLFGGIDPTGLLLGSAFQPIQTPAQCQRNPNKPICLQFQMQQQTQQQMQMVFSLLQNMFAQLMDLINTLLQQNFATQAGNLYAGGIPPTGYPPYDPYGGGAYGAPSPYGDPYSVGGGSVAPIPPGYDVGSGAADPFSQVPADVNAAYAGAGPGSGYGPFAAPPPNAQLPQSPFPDQQQNIISSDSLPAGADVYGGGDVFSSWFGGSGDASQIAPPAQFTANTAYSLPPPPQYSAAPILPQAPMIAPGSTSVTQGPGAQMVMAQPGSVFQQAPPIYDDGSSMPLFSMQPADADPFGGRDVVAEGTPQYETAGLFKELQLPVGNTDEIAIGEDDGSFG